MIKEFNGYPSFATWNTCLHINNFEKLYFQCVEIAKSNFSDESKAIRILKATRRFFGGSRTPDKSYISLKACKIWLNDFNRDK